VKYAKEIKVGLFTIIGVALLIMGYNFLRGFNPLLRYHKYYVVYNNVSGVVKSTQVTINGFKVGQVESISMLHTGNPNQMVVSIYVDRDIKLAKGTTATIISPAFIGTTDIVITPATGDVYYASNDTLVAGSEESLSGSIQKIVKPLQEKSEQVLVTLDKVLGSMNSVFDSTGTQKLATGINELSSALKHLNNITQRFDELTASENDKLKHMLSHMESITRNLKNNNENISKALKNVSKISDSLAAADLVGTIAHTSSVMKQFAATLQNINEGNGTLGKLANDDSLYVNITKSSAELTALLKDIQEYPGRYFNVSVFGGNSRAKEQDKKRAESLKK
jgi:phospholipid/cholesterol/gamma-HCH transport system substrate-binding protein